MKNLSPRARLGVNVHARHFVVEHAQWLDHDSQILIIHRYVGA